MYGSPETDPAVKYYDETLGVTASGDASWYLRTAQRFGDPVLDLGCGTGRVSLLLARKGLQVIALDQSAGMLAMFREKLRREGPAVRDRIRILQAGMADLRLGTRFRTIICIDAFFHNLTVADEIACLGRVGEHLAPEGRFLFNLPNPTCEFILRAARGRQTFGRARTYGRPEAPGTITVERLERGDLVEQMIDTRLRFTVRDEDGVIVECSDSQRTSRYLFRYEAVHLLFRCGFQVEELVGGYDGWPVGAKGQLIFQARLRS